MNWSSELIITVATWPNIFLSNSNAITKFHKFRRKPSGCMNNDQKEKPLIAIYGKKIHGNAREGYKDSRVNWRVWSQKKWDTSRTLDSIKTTIKWNEFWILAYHGLRKFMLNIILLRNICIRIHLYVKEADQTHQKVEKSWNKMVSRNKT